MGKDADTLLAEALLASATAALPADNVEEVTVQGEESCPSEVEDPDGWNSDDEPPKDHVGDEATCCRDGGVKKFIRKVGFGMQQPAQYDIVLIRWRPLPPKRAPDASPLAEESKEDKANREAAEAASREALEVALSEDMMPLAVECAVRKMRIGEVAEVVGPAAYSAKASPLSGRRLRDSTGRMIRSNKVPRTLRFMPQAPRELWKLAQEQTSAARANPAEARPHFRVEVELVRIDPVLVFTEDACVRKQVLSVGIGRRTPNNGDLVTFSTSPCAEDSSESVRHSAVLGEDNLAYPGLEHVLLSMKEEERCLTRFLAKLPAAEKDVQEAARAEERVFVTMHHAQRRDTIPVPFAGSEQDVCPVLKKFELRRGPERWNYAIEDGSNMLIALEPLHVKAGTEPQRILLSWCLGEGAVPKYLEVALVGMRMLEVAEFRTPQRSLTGSPAGPSFVGQTPLRRASVPEVLPLVTALFELQNGGGTDDLPPLAISLPDSWRTAGEPVQWEELAVEPAADSGEEIAFRVAMLAGSEAADVCLLDEETQVVFLEREKARGNALVKAGRFPEGIAAYNKALDTVRHTPVYKALFPTCRGHMKGAVSRESNEIADALNKFEPEELATRKASLVALHLNLALCAGKDGQLGLVRLHTTTVLGADAKNVKALYRRGSAASSHGDYELALIDLQKAAELEPQDKAIRSELTELRVKIKRQQAEEKAMFAKAFKPKPRAAAVDTDDMPELEDVDGGEEKPAAASVAQ